MARAIGRSDWAERHVGEVVAVPKSPLYQAYQVLHWGFCALPVIAGLDKFAHLLVDWDKYLAPQISAAITTYTGFTGHQFMLAVGVVEVLAGLLVALRPHIGAYVVAAWLGGIIANLILAGSYFDVALRDFGLMVSAIALGRLARHFGHAHAPDDSTDDDDAMRHVPAKNRRLWRHRDDDVTGETGGRQG